MRAEADHYSHNGEAGVYVTGNSLAKLDDCYLEDNGSVGLLIEESAGGHVRGSRIDAHRGGGVVARGANAPILEGSAVTGNGGPAVSLPEALRPEGGGRPKSIAGVPAKSIHYLSPSDALPTSDPAPTKRPRLAEGLVCMVSGIECRALARIFLTARKKAGDPIVYFAAPLLGYLVDGALASIERTANADLCAALFPEGKRSEARSRLELGIEALAREPMKIRGYRCEVRFVDEGVYLAFALAPSRLHRGRMRVYSRL